MDDAAEVTRAAGRRKRGAPRGVWAAVACLLLIMVVFFVIRLTTDVPEIVRGLVPPPPAFERRYVVHPIPAYVHIVPGMVYLLGAPFQLSRRFRTGHLPRHRAVGRVLLAAGLVAGVLALVVGIWFPYGGPIESVASVVFGLYFLIALVTAFRAIRRRDVARHRRFMIRAFAIGLGVATIRIWVGIFQLAGLLAIQNGTGTVWFGIAFWLGLGMNALAAEIYLRRAVAGQRLRAGKMTA
jgi:uncharacterized membrane protein YozB (DUF420 family)